MRCALSIWHVRSVCSCILTTSGCSYFDRWDWPSSLELRYRTHISWSHVAHGSHATFPPHLRHPSLLDDGLASCGHQVIYRIAAHSQLSVDLFERIWKKNKPQFVFILSCYNLWLLNSLSRWSWRLDSSGMWQCLWVFLDVLKNCCAFTFRFC
jgi:hypothetical protein